MQTISQIIGTEARAVGSSSALIPSVGCIGLELELEGLRRQPNVEGWAIHPDGSLRNGIEYVFDGPQGGDQAINTIARMGEMLRQNPADPSFRCSTHIHMDVRDLTLLQYERLVLAYTLLEGVLFDHCSAERRYSNFCVPYMLNSALPRRFTQLFKGQAHGIQKVSSLMNWPKYSALNLKPTAELGSVEYRGSHALVDSGSMIALVNRMLHLKRIALEVDATPLEFVERLRNMQLIEVFQAGLNTGYIQEEQQADDCYANALSIAGAPWVYDPSEAPRRELPIFGHTLAWGTPPRPVRQSSTIQVRISTSTFRRYNLAPSAAAGNLETLLQIHTALQLINGIEVPTLSDLIHEPSAQAVGWSNSAFADACRSARYLPTRHNLGAPIAACLGIS